MNRFLLGSLFLVCGTANAQYDVPSPAPGPAAVTLPAPKPTPEEIAFAQLPADIQQMLPGMTPAQAMRMVDQARQQLIALGVPHPTREQFRTTLGAVLNDTPYVSASAGATTFPPLSPLVPPPSLQR
jgi:hypothetical protein